ncbi:enoyl-CoA hydratase/isomerase family protein [Pseudochryseolinea flava]|uniref:Enoyl-CoA hydratase/isomerase family protein n=1 Tax=Pseudochryseolinea flava TaxID=2059302 RepID=A0A364Y2C7_9BACT|nr:enoyl-CoA hydratase-related protein [Pseudochryseolinea flava]RAW01025.1 enoyl-CoA hydratase/isomerase family protein [Pseudochryseolinea flava]
MNVAYSIKDRIGYITLTRPEKRNALNFEVVQQLKDLFHEAERDDAVKVVVLRAEGDAFCAGADLGYLQSLQKNSYAENLEDSNHLKELFLQIYTLKKVVIAQIQGHALAGGCGLATVCDFAITVPEAKFGYTEVRIGFIPAIVMVFLLRKIGEGKAKQLLLGGELITAQDAINMGLINKVVAKEKLEDEVYQLASSLIENNSAQSMMTTKKMIAEVQSMSLDEALTFAAKSNALARESDDCKKGIASFLNKEKFKW